MTQKLPPLLPSKNKPIIERLLNKYKPLAGISSEFYGLVPKSQVHVVQIIISENSLPDKEIPLCPL